MDKVVLELSSVSKSFKQWILGRRSYAIRDLTFAIKPGKVTALVGPNGAGKSTTIGIILGFRFPDVGKVSVLGSWPNSPLVKRKIGFVSEIHPCFKNFSAKEQLSYLGKFSGIPSYEIEERVGKILDRVELSYTGNKQGRAFSKGMAQRLGLAQAILHKPELLVLDEPTSGLDPEGRHLFSKIVQQEKNQGTTIFLSSHILADIEKLCDTMLVMKSGQLLASIDIAEFSHQVSNVQIICKDTSPTRNLISHLKEKSFQITNHANDTVAIVCQYEEKADVLSYLLTLRADIITVKSIGKNLEDYYISLIHGASCESADDNHLQ